MAASTDYDAPRRNAELEPDDDTAVSRIRIRRPQPSASALGDDPDPFEPGLSGLEDAPDEALTVLVLPIQAGEFTCTSCYLICHPSQHSSSTTVCLDCAA